MQRPISETEKRKQKHLRICINEYVEYGTITTGFENLEDITLSLSETNFFGKSLSFPIIVSPITGGCKEAKQINRDIASVCQEFGIGMALGSMKAMLENPNLTETYQVRDIAPYIFLAANIGAVDLHRYKEGNYRQIQEAMEKLRADALSVYFNPEQMKHQKEKKEDKGGKIERIKEIAKVVPVYVKEVGAGIEEEIVRKLRDSDVKAIDVAGAGGTNFAYVEWLRAGAEGEFIEKGIPTKECLEYTVEILKGTDKKIIVSGGIRSKEDIAKAIHLGGDLVAVGLPILKAWYENRRKGIKRYLVGLLR